MIQTIVVATHEYQWLLWPFASLFAKYWGQETITWVGDRPEGDLPENVRFMRVPCYADGIWKWDRSFGNGFNSIMEYYGSWVVCVFLPDQWLSASVDRRGIELLAHYMYEHNDVIRGHLVGDTPFYIYGGRREDWLGREIWEGKDPHVGVDAAITFPPSLWNAKAVKGLFEPGWTLWQCESLGTDRVRQNFPELRVAGIYPPPLYRAHVLNHYDHNVDLRPLCEEDRELVKQFVNERWWKVIE